MDYFTNIWRFPDDPTKSNILGWKITYFRDNYGKPVKTKIKIPVNADRPTLANDPASSAFVYSLSFHQTNGGWYRSNRISTATEIKAKNAAPADG